MRKIPAFLFISPIENGVLASAALNTSFNQLRSQIDHVDSNFKIDRRWRGKGRSKAVQMRNFTGVGTSRTRIYLPWFNFVVVFFLPSGLQNHIDICIGVDLQFQILSDFNSITWPALAIRDHVKIERHLLSTISVQLLDGDLRGD